MKARRSRHVILIQGSYTSPSGYRVMLIPRSLQYVSATNSRWQTWPFNPQFRVGMGRTLQRKPTHTIDLKWSAYKWPRDGPSSIIYLKEASVLEQLLTPLAIFLSSFYNAESKQNAVKANTLTEDHSITNGVSGGCGFSVRNCRKANYWRNASPQRVLI